MRALKTMGPFQILRANKLCLLLSIQKTLIIGVLTNNREIALCSLKGGGSYVLFDNQFHNLEIKTNSK